MPQMGMDLKLVQLIPLIPIGMRHMKNNQMAHGQTTVMTGCFKPGAMKEIATYADGIGLIIIC